MRRIEEPATRRQAITEMTDKLKAARPAGGHPGEIFALLVVF